VPYEAKEEDSDIDNIETLFGDDDIMDMPMMTDEQAALVAAFETARNEETRQFMVAEQCGPMRRDTRRRGWRGR
jgi:hypothetical protein